MFGGDLLPPRRSEAQVSSDYVCYVAYVGYVETIPDRSLTGKTAGRMRAAAFTMPRLRKAMRQPLGSGPMRAASATFSMSSTSATLPLFDALRHAPSGLAVRCERRYRGAPSLTAAETQFS